jgi:cell division protein FtsA
MKSIQNPVGMTAVRLEAGVHMITGSISSTRNIVNCCNKAGLEVCHIALGSLASGNAVLTNDEKQLGCLVIDMGGGITNMALFKDNNLKYIYELTLGGQNLTNDISIGLRCPLSDAENIKIAHGTCVPKNDPIIEIQGTGGKAPKKISRSILAEILEPRVEEIFTLLKREISKEGLENLYPAGLILTGGSVIMDGIVEIAESVFSVPVRIGYPNQLGGFRDILDNPAFATGVGLVIFGSQASEKNNIKDTDTQDGLKIINRMKQWFKDII